MSLRELPVRDHKLRMTALVGMARKNYALRDVPKILHKLIMGWAMEYVEAGDTYGFDGLWRVVSDESDRYLENLAVLECVPWEHLEECVRNTRNLLMGVEA